MKRAFTLFGLGLCVAGFAQTENFWTKKSDFAGLKRERAIAFSLNGKGYVGTGVDTNETVHNDLWEYDTGLDTWTQKANMPGSVRRDAVAFTVGDKGYVGTGIDSAEAFAGTILKDFWEYNPLTNAWAQKADYPGGGGGGVYFATAFSLEGKGFVCCGKIGPADYIDEVWEYKPLTDSWTQRGNFPGGDRYQLSSFVVNNYAYVGLGVDYNIYREDIWEYSPGSDSWVQKSNFAGGERGSASTFTLGERGFICLGVDGGLKTDLWEYNPHLDSWTARDSYGGSSRKSAVAFTVNGKAYVGTGDGYSGKKASMYEYTPVAVLGTEDAGLSETISVFPNPVTDQFTLTATDSRDKIFALYTADGKFLANVVPGVRTERNGLAPGIYLLVVTDTHTNATGTRKLIFL